MSSPTPSVPAPVQYQPVSTTLPPSLVRTLVPFLAGLVATWLTKLIPGVDLDSATLSSLLTAAYGYVYYVVVRLLEVYGSDKWGYILGFRSLPSYASTPLPTTVVTTDDTGTSDRGAVDLGFVGFILATVGLIGLVIALINDTATGCALFAVVFVVGVVLAVLGSGRRRIGR